jgi:hypothetical protein
MHFHGPCIDLTIRVEIAVKMLTGKLAIVNFYAAYFDNSVALRRIQTRSFSIKYYLAHIILFMNRTSYLAIYVNYLLQLPSLN